MKRAIGWAAALLLLAGAVFLVPTLWFQPWSIDHFYARVFAEFALRHPLLLTQLGLFDSLPFDPIAGKLDDFSIAAQRSDLRLVERDLAMLRRYDVRGMSREQRLSHDVLERFLADRVDGGRFTFHDYPVNQLFGFQSTLPNFLLTTQPLNKPRDAEAYVARVGRFGVAIAQIVAGLAYSASIGAVL